MKKLYFIFLLPLFLVGCTLFPFKKEGEDASNNNQSITANLNEQQENRVDLGFGYYFTLPKGWKVVGREENKKDTLVQLANLEIVTRIEHNLRSDYFGPAIHFYTFSIDSTLSVSDIVKKAKYFYCPINNSSEQLQINSLPVYEMAGSSDVCEGETEVFYRKYYTIKPQNKEETLIMIFYTKSEDEYKEFQDEFDVILNSIQKAL